MGALHRALAPHMTAFAARFAHPARRAAQPRSARPCSPCTKRGPGSSSNRTCALVTTTRLARWCDGGRVPFRAGFGAECPCPLDAGSAIRRSACGSPALVGSGDMPIWLSPLLRSESALRAIAHILVWRLFACHGRAPRTVATVSYPPSLPGRGIHSHLHTLTSTRWLHRCPCRLLMLACCAGDALAADWGETHRCAPLLMGSIACATWVCVCE